MRRREFITLLGGAAASWPLAARAQQPGRLPMVGLLHVGSAGAYTNEIAAFGKGLKESGYIDGSNVAIEFRWADGQYDRLPELTAELIRRRVAVIAAFGPPAALAAASATKTIPIVATSGADPVKLGLVATFNRPGGNVTGVSFLVNALGAKQLQLLRDLVPTAKVIGLLVNPNNPSFESEIKDVEDATRNVGQQLVVQNAASDHDIDVAFAHFAERQVNALIVAADVFLNGKAEKIVALATHYAFPTIGNQRTLAAAGSLLGYGTDITDGYRQAGVYAGRILKGESPADLPVVQSTKFRFVINLKTAKALGITIPPGVLAIADEVVE